MKTVKSGSGNRPPALRIRGRDSRMLNTITNSVKFDTAFNRLQSFAPLKVGTQQQRLNEMRKKFAYLS